MFTACTRTLCKRKLTMRVRDFVYLSFDRNKRRDPYIDGDSLPREQCAQVNRREHP